MHRRLVKGGLVSGLMIIVQMSGLAAAETIMRADYNSGSQRVLLQSTEQSEKVQALNVYYTDWSALEVIQYFHSDVSFEMIQSQANHQVQAINYVGQISP